MFPGKTYYYALLLTVNLLLYNGVKAQSLQHSAKRYYVEHFGEEEGLTQNSINSILPDKNDFLWIATEGGITRFNGNRFLNVPGTGNITGSNFTRIKNFYFKGKDTIIAYSASNHRVAIIVNNKMVAVEEMQFQKYGMLFVNMHSPVPAPAYLTDPAKNPSGIIKEWNISGGSINGTAYNKDTFLVHTYAGIGVYDAKGKIKEIKPVKPAHSNILFLDQQIIYLDEQNYINCYSLAGFQKRELLAIQARRKPAIFKNNFGNNFFCVADSTLYLVDITSGKAAVQKILTNLHNAADITTIYQKDSNTIVTGTLRNGLYVYKKQYFQTTDPLPDEESDAFYGQVLFPDNQTILAGKDNLFRDGRYIGKTKAVFTTNIYSTIKDSKGYYWYIYNDCILRAREIGVAPDTMLYLSGVRQLLFEDKQGNVWINSNDKFGYFSNGRFTELTFPNFNCGVITCMRQDIQGSYLIGTRNGLFSLKDIHDTALKGMPGFNSFDIRFIWPEANGQTWICTYGRGIYLLTQKDVIAFPDNNGRLAYVHCIIEDAKGNFWLPANSGLFVTSRESLMNYIKNRNEVPFYYQFSKKHGLRTNEFNGAGQPPFLHLSNGDMSLPSMQGLVRFNPATINFNFSSSPILVDNIQADSTEVLQRDEFDIANNVNNISFSLSSSFWGEKENDLLEYQVVEKGKPRGLWIPVDASGIINLFTPSFGNYTLLVRKRKGLKTADYVYRQINFKVMPKWYQTKTFLLFAALALICILTAISAWRRRNYRRVNRILKSKVNAATIELQQMNNNLEKKVAERTIAIREAEIKFRTLVEGSLVGVYILQNKRFIYLNPRFEQILGYGPGELTGTKAILIISERHRDIAAEKVRLRISGETETEQYEIEGIKKDGSKCQLEFFGSRTIYEGKPTIIGTMLDITEKKIAEDQLIKEKNLSQSIINSLPGVFYVFDQQGKYHLWNRNHETVTGYTAEEMSNMHPDRFIEEKEKGILHERVEKVFTEGYAELEANFIRKDGTGIPYYFNGISIIYDDIPCIMGVGLDVSEQKKAEDELIIEKDLSQSIINSLPGVFFIFDQNRKHQLWNKNFETVTGYNSEELKEKLAGTCIAENDLVLFTKAVEKMYETGNAEVEVMLINKYKKHIPFYVNGIAITYEGKPCILGIGIDISERKKAEEGREYASYLLNERIKELTTLYRAGLVLQQEERSLLVALHDFVSVLPAGWQFPDITAACVTLGEMEFATPDFRSGPFSQVANFTTSKGNMGKIEVVYLEERPQDVEGPFLAEERKLIDMLADMLKVYLTKKETNEALQKSEANLNTIFETTDTVYVLLNENLQVIAFNQRAAAFSEKEFKQSFRTRTNFVEYFSDSRRPEVAANLEKVKQGSHVSYEISYPQDDGSLSWYYVRMFPITNAAKAAFGMMMAVSDITEKKQLEQEILDQKVQEQKKVIRAILIGEEKERNKIGQELHDNINQILAGTKIYLGMARKVKEGRDDIIKESIALIDSAIEEIRTFSKGKVTPIKKVNLEELLQLLIDDLVGKTTIHGNLVFGGDGHLIEDDLKINIYRIIQEQLNNILKHAMAKNISVQVEVTTEKIHVLVKDDGKGFEVNAQKNGIGISNMINRVESFNGTIDIVSSAGNGCTITINIPF